MSPVDAARALGVTTRDVLALVADGTLRAEFGADPRIGARTLLVSADDVASYARAH